MHPLHHAKSSAARLGGNVEDFVAVHAYMDESKQAFCNPMHRTYRHNMDILPELVELFGEVLPSRPDVDMRAVLQDHLKEDCKGTTPSIEDWLMHLTPAPWMKKNMQMSTYDHAVAISDKFGGQPEEYLAICQYMDGAKHYENLSQWRHRAWRWHSFATFDAEKKFGVSFKNSVGRNVIVRYVAEKHIIAALGKMPTMQDWYSHIRFQSFMAGNHVIAGVKSTFEVNA